MHPQRHGRGGARAASRIASGLIVVLSLGAAGGAAAAREALDRIVEACEGRAFRLGVDLHEPEPGGNPAPSLDEKGWHYNDPNRPIVLRAGEEVEVTGVFNYGDRGIFLEVTRKDRARGEESAPRIRVRFTAEAPPDTPDLQATQIRALIGRVLRPSPP